MAKMRSEQDGQDEYMESKRFLQKSHYQLGETWY